MYREEPDSSRDGAVPAAWVRFLRVHDRITRAMDACLRRRHGLTLSDYEVLLHLSWAPGRRLRRVDLAERLLLTQSGVTRLLAGLERDGLVERIRCDDDARVAFAQLTDAGERRLREAAATHVRDVREMFAGRLTPRQLDTLADLLGRLPGGDITPRHEHPVGSPAGRDRRRPSAQPAARQNSSRSGSSLNTGPRGGCSA